MSMYETASDALSALKTRIEGLDWDNKTNQLEP